MPPLDSPQAASQAVDTSHLQGAVSQVYAKPQGVEGGGNPNPPPGNPNPPQGVEGGGGSTTVTDSQSQQQQQQQQQKQQQSQEANSSSTSSSQSDANSASKSNSASDSSATGGKANSSAQGGQATINGVEGGGGGQGGKGGKGGNSTSSNSFSETNNSVVNIPFQNIPMGLQPYVQANECGTNTTVSGSSPFGALGFGKSRLDPACEARNDRALKFNEDHATREQDFRDRAYQDQQALRQQEVEAAKAAAIAQAAAAAKQAEIAARTHVSDRDCQFGATYTDVGGKAVNQAADILRTAGNNDNLLTTAGQLDTAGLRALAGGGTLIGKCSGVDVMAQFPDVHFKKEEVKVEPPHPAPKPVVHHTAPKKVTNPCDVKK